MKKRILKMKPSYAAGLVIFLLMLLFSTRVVMAMRGLLVVETIPVALPRENLNILYDIYYITISDNVDGEVEVAGHAFMETAEDNPEKRIDLIVQSKDHTYIVPSELSVQHSLSAKATGKMIQGVRHTFSAKFSMLLLPDGIYELGLYCYENESTQGYVSIGRRYLKEGRSFERKMLPMSGDRSLPATESNGIDLLDVDQISCDPLPWHYAYMEDYDSNYIYLKGWIAIVSLDSNKAKSFVSLTGEDGRTKVYTTFSYESKEVEEEVGSSLANHGFFDAYIPLDDLPAGDYTVQFIVQYPEMTRKPERSHKLSISKDGRVTYIP